MSVVARSDHGAAVLTGRAPFGRPGADRSDPHLAAMLSTERARPAGQTPPARGQGRLLAGSTTRTPPGPRWRRWSRGRPGQAYRVVDDLPATWQEVYTAMAEAFGTPLPPRVPRWLFRLAAPYVASLTIDASMRVSKAKAELGWRSAFPGYRHGVRAAAAQKEVPWRSPRRSGAGTRSA